MYKHSLAAVAGVAAVFASGSAMAGKDLDAIKARGSLICGVGTGTAGFMLADSQGKWVGLDVDVCRAVAADLKRQLRLANLKVDYVPVTAETSFAAVRDGQVDILCGPTTQSLARRALVDFSLMTFIDGASVIYRKGGPLTFTGLAGHKIGVHTFYRPKKWGDGSEAPSWGTPAQTAALSAQLAAEAKSEAEMYPNSIRR